MLQFCRRQADAYVQSLCSLSCIVLNQRCAQQRCVDVLRVLASAMQAAAPCVRHPSLLRGPGRPVQRYRRPPLRPAAASAAPPGGGDGGGKQGHASAPVSGPAIVCKHAGGLGSLLHAAENAASSPCMSLPPEGHCSPLRQPTCRLHAPLCLPAAVMVAPLAAVAAAGSFQPPGAAGWGAEASKLNRPRTMGRDGHDQSAAHACPAAESEWTGA